ncbi:MAG: hypothetical protein U9Q83_09410, partial [Bacteroidota bacterium]|nr:hypothetical protein [Bacteroidota bacterium]
MYHSKSFFEKIDEQDMFQIISEDLSVGVKLFYNTFELEPSSIIEMVLESVNEIEKVNTYSEKIIIIDYDLRGIIDYLFDIIEDSYGTDFQIWDINVLQKHFDKIKDEKSKITVIKKNHDFELTKFPVSKTFNNNVFAKTFDLIDREFFINQNSICVLHKEIFGCGKTNTAVEYAFARKNKFKYIVYISIKNDFRVDFMNSFFHSSLFSSSNSFYNFDDNVYFNFYKLVDIISAIESEILFVVDGVNRNTDVAIIKDLFNELKHKLLIVSSTKLVEFPNVELFISKKKTAIEFFESYVAKFNKSEFEEIFEKLDYNLFLINFIGKFLKNNNTINFRDVYKAIKLKESKIYHLVKYMPENLSSKGETVNRGLFKSVMAVYEIQIINFTSFQKNILTILSVFSNTSFSLNELQNLMQIPNKKVDSFIDSILDLHNQGWIFVEKNTIFVNEIVRAVLHKKLKPKTKDLKNVINYIINELITNEISIDTIRFWNYSITLLDNIMSISISLSKLAEVIASISNEFGYWKLSIEQYDMALYIYESIASKQ